MIGEEITVATCFFPDQPSKLLEAFYVMENGDGYSEGDIVVIHLDRTPMPMKECIVILEGNPQIRMYDSTITEPAWAVFSQLVQVKLRDGNEPMPSEL